MPDATGAELGAVLDAAKADVLVVGHTHVAMELRLVDRMVVNPGALLREPAEGWEGELPTPGSFGVRSRLGRGARSRSRERPHLRADRLIPLEVFERALVRLQFGGMSAVARLQRFLLEYLGTPGAETRLARAGFGFQRAAAQLSPPPAAHEVQAAVWSLVARGLAYLDTSQIEASNWSVRITPAGRAVLSDEEFNPHDPAGFLDRLERAVPKMSDIVKQYMREALEAYNHQLFLASTVMLGAASEAAFLEMATAFVGTLSGTAKDNFEQLLHGTTNYVAKFSEFRKRVEPAKNTLPEDCRDGMSVMLDAVLDLLRCNRNDAGHPTGRRFERDDCFTSLQIAARYLARLYGLKAHFELAASP